MKICDTFFDKFYIVFLQKIRIMKIVQTFILILFISFQSLGQDKAEFKFESEILDYGKIKQGSNGVRVFEFTNIGSSPLIIDRIVASCGCTVPKKPEEPIMPGKKGKIEVSYDTKRVGGFSKAITIFSNAKSTRKMLRIKGYVEKSTAPEKEKSMLSEDNSK